MPTNHAHLIFFNFNYEVRSYLLDYSANLVSRGMRLGYENKIDKNEFVSQIYNIGISFLESILFSLFMQYLITGLPIESPCDGLDI